MRSLLIIGGSGFFGKSILHAYRRGLLNQWDISRIYVYARNASQLWASNPELIDDSVCLIDGDITTCKDLPDADFVIHAAASTDASRYTSRLGSEKENILYGTENFCKVAQIYLKKSKILYVSSGVVYGSTSHDKRPFKESDSFIPLAEIEPGKRDYAAAKRESERQIGLLGESGLAVVIARCFSFVGCYLPRDQHFAIGNFIANGLKGEDIQVKTPKYVYRSYMFADDLVQWLMTMLNSATNKCPVFNVGSDEIVELRELAKILGNHYCVDVISSEPEKDCEVDFYIPSIENARNILGLKFEKTILNDFDKLI